MDTYKHFFGDIYKSFSQKVPSTYIKVGLREKVRGLNKILSSQFYKGRSEHKTTRSII